MYISRLNVHHAKQIIIALMCMLLVIPAFAQDDAADFTDEELEQINYVIDAFEKFTQVESYTVSGTVFMDMLVTADGQEIAMTIDQTMGGAYLVDDGALEAFSLVTQMNMAMGGQSFMPDSTTEMILADGELYMRIDDADWTTIGDDELMANMLDSQAYTDMLGMGFDTFMTPDHFLTVEALEGTETADGAPLRVIAVTYDMQAMMDDELVNDLLGDVFDSSLGVDMQDMMATLMESMEVSAVMYINTEDLLIHRIEQTMTFDADLEMMGTAMNMDATIISDTTYSDFNAPVEITAPES